MAKIKLRIIRDPMVPPPWVPPPGAGPLFTGTGDTDYVCGSCEFVIAAKIGPGQRINPIETDCPRCGAVNEVTFGED
jgi:phage FluMu protein Com